ncbi:ATP-dependent DNA ligase [Brevibacillus brevis]|uniref:ATP-dependent DNA ligase n=1 Tax=Brevibacillus brevis TaxID=1393 RepID=UPI0007D89F94|nr:RNA ligase family protein [Brevibacillus brevis]
MLNTPIKPMLLQKSDSPPSGNLIHQLKFDGFRCLLHYDQGQIRLFTRHQNECTTQFPEIQPDLNCSSAIIDGEMIVMDGIKPCWESVMKRFQTTKPISIKHLMSTIPAHFVAFDIIYVNNQSTVSMPLIDRLNLLESIVEPSNSISICPSSSDGQQLFNRVKELGLEGICSKSLNSRYLLDTRSDHWLKTKVYMYETVTVTGIKKSEFACSLSKDGDYVGTMEFVNKEARAKLHQRSKSLIVNESNDWRYVKPEIQCKVKFQCYTKSGLMRSPSFVEFVL